MKDPAGAIDACKKALAIDPQDAQAWYNLGIALADQKDLAGAIDAFKKASKINPSYANAHGAMGLVLRDQGNFVEAIAATERALNLLPKGHSLRPAAERLLKQCQQLLALEQRLPDVLKGSATSAAELLALADLCLRYKQRYADAVVLFDKAFAA